MKRNKQLQHAREMRKQPTKSERLLWGLLRGRQLCDLRFRHQHLIGPYIVDFACVAKQLVVEVDGGYHEATREADVAREALLRQLGWDVIRFTDEQVLQDVEAVGIAIARHLKIPYELRRRKGNHSGMLSEQAPDGPKRSV